MTSDTDTRSGERSNIAAAAAVAAMPGKRRGRPLAIDRTPAILKATVQLVDEVGYDHLRMQDVADSAGVGLATIYRRWPTKQSLFIDALRAKDLDLPDTGDTRADLIDIFQRLAEGLQNEKAQLVPGCIAVARDEPEIAQAFRESVAGRARAHIRMLIAREVGDDDPDLDLRADLASGVIVYRGMMHGERTRNRKTFERLADIALGPWPKPNAEAAPKRRKRNGAARAKARR